MHSLYDLCDMLDDEVRQVVQQGDISPSELDRVYKAVDIIKDIKTIDAMENSYDSYRGSYDSYDNMGNSNRMYRDGRRGRDGDNDGRYSEDGYSNRRGRDARGRYTSRDSYDAQQDKMQMIQKLDEMKKSIEQMQ